MSHPQFPPPPPPPGRRGRTWLVLGLGALALVVVAATAVVLVLVTRDDDDSYEEFLAEVEEARSASPSDSPPDRDTDPSGPTDPTEDPAEILERNPLYSVDVMAAAGCAGGSQAPLSDTTAVRAYYRSVLPCLDRAWEETLSGSEIDFQPAGLEVFSGPAQGSCGAGQQYSFYCPDTMTIHMYADEISGPWNQYAGDDFSHGITRLAALHTLAHEYGHHLQQITGILPAMGSGWSGTELERRSELQASCLGNVWLAAQRGAYPVDGAYWDPQWEPLWRFITSLPSHGSPSNQKRWTDAGFSTARAGSCNTWTAGPATVT